MINNNDGLLTNKWRFGWVNKNPKGTRKIDDLSRFSGKGLSTHSAVDLSSYGYISYRLA